MSKRSVPDSERLAVAIRYGAQPGVRIEVPCHYCGVPGHVYRFIRRDGTPSSRVHFGHELDHVNPEHLGGLTVADNLVLACRRCNRSKGTGSQPGHWAIGRQPYNFDWKEKDRQRRARRRALRPQ